MMDGETTKKGSRNHSQAERPKPARTFEKACSALGELDGFSFL
jgi:hypothetical protein